MGHSVFYVILLHGAWKHHSYVPTEGLRLLEVNNKNTFQLQICSSGRTKIDVSLGTYVALFKSQ